MSSPSLLFPSHRILWVCMSVPKFPLLNDIGFMAPPPPPRYDLNFTNYICNNSIFNQGCIMSWELGFQHMNLGKHNSICNRSLNMCVKWSSSFTSNLRDPTFTFGSTIASLYSFKDYRNGLNQTSIHIREEVKSQREVTSCPSHRGQKPGHRMSSFRNIPARSHFILTYAQFSPFLGL